MSIFRAFSFLIIFALYPSFGSFTILFVVFRWYFRRLLDGNFSLYNKGAQMYLTLTPDKTGFVVGPWTGDENQKFYVRSFWNGYTINCQIDLGYFNYVTVSSDGEIKSEYFNGNPKTR